MPCYRCGARQVDPARGPSPWKRGVRSNQQVLVCPGCQAGSDWTADLDRCPNCGSVRLVRRLGEVECRDCGLVEAPEEPAGPAAEPVAPAGEPEVPAARAAAGPAAGAAGGAAAPADGPAGPGQPAGEAGGGLPELAAEVALALERMFGRSAPRPPASVP